MKSRRHDCIGSSLLHLTLMPLPAPNERSSGETVFRGSDPACGLTLWDGARSPDLPRRWLKLPLWEEAQFHVLGLALECSRRLPAAALLWEKPPIKG